MLIGVYDYTVILTYLSLISAMCGIIVSTAGDGHPYIGAFFLLFSGLCDTFDGKVARRKKNRSKRERSFGVQIDSLSDLVAFGVQPACIAVGLLQREGRGLRLYHHGGRTNLYTVVFVLIVVLYVLAALIRLAYFNVLDEEHFSAEGTGSKKFIGLPVTSAALIFPIILLLNYYVPRDLSRVYMAALVVTGVLFLGHFEIKKPGRRLITIMIAAGAVEFFLLLGLLFFRQRWG